MTGAIPVAGFSAELDSRYRDRLMAYFISRTRDRSAAEDMTQDVFARLIRQGRLGEVHNRDAFVFATAANLLKDRARRSAFRLERRFADLGSTGDAVADKPSDEDFSPERVLIGRQALADALDALAALGERTRDIFILFRLEHMKQREIAARYGISVSAVEKHVVRALVHLAGRRVDL